MNDPIDHHYLPVLYLSRWAGADKKVCRFSRPYNNRVVANRLTPKATGFEEHLYSMQTQGGVPVPDMEKDFMSRLDSEAAEALKCLESDFQLIEKDARLRSAWSRFVWAQSIRTPSEIKQLKASVKEAWDVASLDLRQRYAEMRRPDDPESFDEYVTSVDPYAEDRFALKIAQRSMDHSGVCQIMNDMYWCVLDFHGCGIPLLTSDRPVWMTASLIETDTCLTIPIGPSRLFVAVRDRATLDRFIFQNRRQQAKNVNRILVPHAINFVIGVDDKMIDFVQKHFATRRHSTHMERLAAVNGYRVLAADSPAQSWDVDGLKDPSVT